MPADAEVFERLARRTQAAQARLGEKQARAEQNRKRWPELAALVDELRAEGFDVKVSDVRWPDE